MSDLCRVETYDYNDGKVLKIELPQVRGGTWNYKIPHEYTQLANQDLANRFDDLDFVIRWPPDADCFMIYKYQGCIYLALEPTDENYDLQNPPFISYIVKCSDPASEILSESIKTVIGRWK